MEHAGVTLPLVAWGFVPCRAWRPRGRVRSHGGVPPAGSDFGCWVPGAKPRPQPAGSRQSCGMNPDALSQGTSKRQPGRYPL